LIVDILNIDCLSRTDTIPNNNQYPTKQYVNAQVYSPNEEITGT